MNRENGFAGLAKLDVLELTAADSPISHMAVAAPEATGQETTAPLPVAADVVDHPVFVDYCAIFAERRAVLVNRHARIRLLAGTSVGVMLLIVAQALQPHGGSPFAAPPDWAAWAAAACGVVGVWLVPGLWLSALITGPETGLAAWLATRIGTTLAWYVLVGPLVHDLGEGARVTNGVVFGMTMAATAAA